MEIRPAEGGDIPALVPLMAAFNALEGIPWRPGPVRRALERLLREPALGRVLVARSGAGGELVGYGVATFGYDLEFGGPDAFITELFVAPEARERGIGRGLLQALLRDLGERGAAAVHLMVRPENDAARALYSSAGFHAVPRVMMTKDLAP
jgi:ribosomal protein S18 acetylase RimI-like enzyme